MNCKIHGACILHSIGKYRVFHYPYGYLPFAADFLFISQKCNDNTAFPEKEKRYFKMSIKRKRLPVLPDAVFCR